MTEVIDFISRNFIRAEVVPGGVAYHLSIAAHLILVFVPLTWCLFRKAYFTKKDAHTAKSH